MAPTSTWKSAEREVCRGLGGDRRGADFKQKHSNKGKNDCVDTPGLSVEVKYSRKLSPGLIQGALEQATNAKENPEDIPVAIIKQYRQSVPNAIVVLRYADFIKIWRKQDV